MSTEAYIVFGGLALFAIILMIGKDAVEKHPEWFSKNPR